MGHQIATDDERRHRITLENSLAFPGLLFPSLYWMFIACHCFPSTRIISKHILAHSSPRHTYFLCVPRRPIISDAISLLYLNAAGIRMILNDFIEKTWLDLFFSLSPFTLIPRAFSVFFSILQLLANCVRSRKSSVQLSNSICSISETPESTGN